MDTTYFDDDFPDGPQAAAAAMRDAGVASNDADPDAVAPQLRRAFTGFTFKHVAWMTTVGANTLAAVVVSADKVGADVPLLLSGAPLGDAETDGHPDQHNNDNGSSQSSSSSSNGGSTSSKVPGV